MAVAAEHRRRGIGAALLSAAHAAAAAEGVGRIRLNAQLSARSVYERAGYESEGWEFLDQGIEHVTMERRLA